MSTSARGAGMVKLNVVVPPDWKAELEQARSKLRLETEAQVVRRLLREGLDRLSVPPAA